LSSECSELRILCSSLKSLKVILSWANVLKVTHQWTNALRVTLLKLDHCTQFASCTSDLSFWHTLTRLLLLFYLWWLHIFFFVLKSFCSSLTILKTHAHDSVIVIWVSLLCFLFRVHWTEFLFSVQWSCLFYLVQWTQLEFIVRLIAILLFHTVFHWSQLQH